MRDQLGDSHEVNELVETHGSIDAVLHAFEVSPLALTTHGARSRLRTLTTAAEIDVGEGEAQDLGRHTDMGTTEDGYRHPDAEKQRERLDGLLEDIE